MSEQLHLPLRRRPGRPRSDSHLIEVHLRLDPRDWQRWTQLFGPTFGASKSVRMVMRDYLARIGREANLGAGLDATK